MTTELPTPPADAYFEMVEILGDSFFLTYAPSQGVEVVVEGKDRVHTTWAVTDAQAIWLKPMVHRNKNLRWVAQRPYDMTLRAA
jgi:hypothetical protein